MTTIKEQIRAEIVRLRDEHEQAVRACSGLNAVSFSSAITHGSAQKVCDEILAFIDTLPDDQLIDGNKMIEGICWHKVTKGDKLSKPDFFLLDSADGMFLCTGDKIHRDGYILFVDELRELPHVGPRAEYQAEIVKAADGTLHVKSEAVTGVKFGDKVKIIIIDE